MRRRSARWLSAGCMLWAAAGEADAQPNLGAGISATGAAPLSYFAAHCARCHGPQGQGYGSDFGRGKSADELRAVIKQMAEGPGSAPLAEPELEAQLALHQAWVARRPFASLRSAPARANAAAGAKVSVGGEATEGAWVRAVAMGSGKELARTTSTATLENPQWNLTVEGALPAVRWEVGSAAPGAQPAVWVPVYQAEATTASATR